MDCNRDQDGHLPPVPRPSLLTWHTLSWQAYNVLRYEAGQKYNSHYDTFNPKEYGPQSSQRVSWGSSLWGCVGLIAVSAGAQIASFLLYLSDVEEGGETMFPFEVRGDYLC